VLVSRSPTRSLVRADAQLRLSDAPPESYRYGAVRTATSAARARASSLLSHFNGRPRPDLQTFVVTSCRHVRGTLIGNIAAVAFEPVDVVPGNAGIPVVPLLQEASEPVLLAGPPRDQIGIFVHLSRRQLKSLCDPLGVARAQGATVLAIAGHQLRWPPVDRNPVHINKPTNGA
jgi:hypothetical protein